MSEREPTHADAPAFEADARAHQRELVRIDAQWNARRRESLARPAKKQRRQSHIRNGIHLVMKTHRAPGLQDTRLTKQTNTRRRRASSTKPR